MKQSMNICFSSYEQCNEYAMYSFLHETILFYNNWNSIP